MPLNSVNSGRLSSLSNSHEEIWGNLCLICEKKVMPNVVVD